MPNRRKTLEEVIYPKIKKTATCWLWTGSVSTTGYGKFGGKFLKANLAHRAMLQLNDVKIPKGMVVDHTCMNRLCVNPAHLRVVTRKVNNTENSNSMAARNKAKTQCKRGHPFVAEKTRGYLKSRGWRECAECRKIYAARLKNKRNLIRSNGEKRNMNC